MLLGALILVVLGSLSTLLGLRTFVAQQARHLQLLQQRVSDQSRPPGLAMGWQIEPALRVIRPPNPNAALIRGLDATAPTYWDFGPSGILVATPSGVRDADDIGPAVDIEFLIRVLLGLLALAISADAHSALTSGGDLVGLTSFPISRVRLWLSQTVGSIAVSCFVWLAVVVSILGAAELATPEAAVTRQLSLTMSALTGPVVLYIAVLTGLGSVVAAFLSQTLHRTLAVFVVWLAICLFGPTTLVSIDRAIHPVSSVSAMVASRDAALAVELRAGEEEMGSALRKRAASQQIADPVPAKLYPELESIWSAHVAEARKQANLIQETWRSEQLLHDRWLDRAEWLSPASLWWRVASDTAGVGRSERRAWDSAARAYEDQLQKELFDDRPQATILMGGQVIAMVRHRPLAIHEVSRFDQNSISAFRSSQRWLAVLVLSGYFGLFMSASTVRFGRRSG